MRKYKYFKELTSTNDYLKTNYRDLPNLSVVVAGHQTKGRGRLSREWLDDAGSILLSIFIKPKENIKINLIPLVASTVVHKFLKSYCINDNLKIKWPNDILLNGKKIAGILVESKYTNSFDYVVVGIGINVNTECFAGDLIPKATSLYLSTNDKYDLKKMYDELIKLFYEEYALFENDVFRFIEYNRKQSAMIGEEVFLDIDGKIREVEVIGISDGGELEVKYDGEVKSFSSGEVTLSKNYNKE